MDKYKLSDKNNKELLNSLFGQIETELGFHPIDISTGSYYFIFGSDEDDTICHFHIKEIPGFLFGLWKTNRFDKLDYRQEHKMPLWTDTYRVDSRSEFIFFTQFERDLDKFKPSRSGFVTGLFRSVWEEGTPPQVKEEWNLFNLGGILNFMKNHFYKSYVYSYSQITDIWDEISGFKCFRIYRRETRYFNRSTRRNKKELKYTLKRVNKVLDKLTLFDYILIDDGELCSPKYELVIRRNVDGYSKRLQKEQDMIDKLDANNKIFKHLNISQYEYDLSEPLTAEEAKDDLNLRDTFAKRYKLLAFPKDKNIDWTVLRQKVEKNSTNFKKIPLPK